MAASFNESQQIDYLWKKLGYGVAKTAGTTGAGAKQAYNESIASPLLYRGDLIWTQSSSIPASPPSNTTDIIQVYKDGGGGGYSPTVECTEDLTSPDNQTWLTNLTNWVPTQFGDNYLIQVYAANIGVTNPQTSGTKLFQSGSGNDDTWFFDYQAGVLNFNGANIPSVITGGVTGKSIYIVGYRYVGIVGLSGGAATGTSISNGSSNVNVVSSGGNVTVGIGGTGNVTVFANSGAYVTGVVSATGNVTSGGVITTGPSGNISGANVVSAITFTATANITGGNLLTTGKISTSGNVYGNAILSDNYYYANGTPVPPGVVYTAAASPPAVPKVSDQWYDINNDVLYEFISDGTGTYWVDSNTPAFANGIVSNVAISGSMVPEANVAFDIGASGAYFRNTYTQNLYTNSRFSAANMPLGAVVQTVMSSTLGGSVTNSTSYADISYASVTITPSSATNKILILATGTSGFSSLAGYGITADTQLVRSPSISLQIQTVATSGTGGVGASGAVSYSYIDAPATTSAVSYKLQQKISNASSTLTSTNIWLIAMEIAAS
jgi:hypothetical protein